MKLYKATRPDGTDFRTGTVNYAKALETGEVLKHPEKLQRNQPSTYFSVSISPTGCTGMSWPCRLFRVEAVGRAFKNDGLENKRCCSSLRVVEELPAHEALGPQGEEIAVLIERCRTLTFDEAKELHAARDAAWDAARGAAWDAAWDAARDAARGAAWDAARGAAWGAALALIAKDLITPEQFDFLYAPWKKVIDK